MNPDRSLAKKEADAAGMFWLPCPICKQEFGGHEAAETSLSTGPLTGRLVCGNCGDEAKRRNAITGWEA